ncbi:hypothetical protein [Streptomyces sp. NPDC058579]|uniref:hypothetical protein n=1 Tax=Streptomyces sp. NPDC058579 TaxID=3346548 RepID=UPI00365FA91F
MFTHRDRGSAEATHGHGSGHEQRTPAAPEHAHHSGHHHPGHPGHLTPAALQAIQRSHGNAAAVRALGRQDATQPAPQFAIQRAGSGDGQASAPAGEQAPQTRYRIQIQTAKNSRTHHLDYWANLALGHAWVALYRDEGGTETWKSYGFFPAEEVAHDKPFRSVKGQVRRNHDHPDQASSKLTAELTEEQYNKAREFIRSNESRSYNLATFNCTTFARSVFQAATGESAPGLGLPLLENPNTLQDSIKRRNDKKGAPRKGENITADVGSNSDYDSDSSSGSSSGGGNWGDPLGGLRPIDPATPDPAAVPAPPPARPAAPARPRFEID